MAVDRINITSPVGRFVAGSLYKPNTQDFDGKPLVTKTGPNAGQPRVDYYIGFAIPKGAEPHWAHTDWGSKIWALGNQAFPQAAQRPDFAWKIIDGDSTIPNKRNRRPCDQEGHPGHWVLKLSGSFAPKVYFQDGKDWIQNLTPDACKPGYYVQLNFSVDDNKQPNNPGVYLNHQAVAFRGFGAEISFGPNVSEMGFGAAPLPAGASMIPLAATMPTGAAPQAPAAPYAPAAAAYPPAPPVQVLPNPAFTQMPPPPGAGGYPPNPNPAAPYPGAISASAGVTQPPLAPAYPSNVRQMTAKAGNVSYEGFRAAGWTDSQLIAEGLMLA